MPIYEYRCLTCAKSFEILVFEGGDEPVCPHCKGENLKRLMSSFGYKSSGSDGNESRPSTAGSSACASCSSGNCSTCH